MKKHDVDWELPSEKNRTRAERYEVRPQRKINGFLWTRPFDPRNKISIPWASAAKEPELKQAVEQHSLVQAALAQFPNSSIMGVRRPPRQHELMQSAGAAYAAPNKHQTQNKDPEIIRVKPAVSERVSKKITKARAQATAIGYHDHVGAFDLCVITGKPAEELDHVPGKKITQTNQYSGPMYTVCTTRAVNRTLSDAPEACLSLRAAKAQYRLNRQRKPESHAQADLIEKRWSTTNFCNCTLCASAQALSRWKECKSDPRIMAVTPRPRRNIGER